MKTDTTITASTVSPTRHSAASNADVLATLKALPSKIRAVHVILAVGVFSVFLGYVSIAPPTDLPNWPLYRLNAKTWQFFESWGQHVKPHHMRIITTTLQHMESRTMYVMAYLDIPDILHKAGKPLSCEEIKTAVDTSSGLQPVNLPFLCRILHAAAHFGFLSGDWEEKYSLTPVSEYLVSTHPRSLKNFVMLYSGDEALVISTSLSRSIFTGESGFKVSYRKELLEHLKEDEYLQTIYDAGLGDSSKLHAPAIISDYPPFSSCKHVCDIGGGVGRFLYEVLQHYSYGMKGTNFDLPDVIKNSRVFLKKMKNGGKINLMGGNFTEKIPDFDCDCYIMKDILQNWSDEDASLILSNLFKVVQKESRVLVMETILHTGSFSEERLKSLMDLTMMAFNPSHSRLRTEEEIHSLLRQAGFEDAQTYPTRAGYSIVEAFPKSA